MKIRVATLEDAQRVADLAIQMWESHTIEELTQEFYDSLERSAAEHVILTYDEELVQYAVHIPESVD